MACARADEIQRHKATGLNQLIEADHVFSSCFFLWPRYWPRCQTAWRSCGGSGDASPASQFTLSGTIADGPIAGATVFLDLNGNMAHDAGEPISLPSAANGAFTIGLEKLSPAQLATALLVAKNGQRPGVLNLSLGGGASASLDTAVANTVAAGYTVVVAAGNDNANACNYSSARAVPSSRPGTHPPLQPPPSAAPQWPHLMLQGWLRSFCKTNLPPVRRR